MIFVDFILTVTQGMNESRNLETQVYEAKTVNMTLESRDIKDEQTIT